LFSSCSCFAVRATSAHTRREFTPRAWCSLLADQPLAGLIVIDCLSSASLLLSAKLK
jgi:hypothetical protein